MEASARKRMEVTDDQTRQHVLLSDLYFKETPVRQAQLPKASFLESNANEPSTAGTELAGLHLACAPCSTSAELWPTTEIWSCPLSSHGQGGNMHPFSSLSLNPIWAIQRMERNQLGTGKLMRGNRELVCAQD